MKYLFTLLCTIVLLQSAIAQTFGNLDMYLESDSVSAVAKEYYYERVKTTLNDSTMMVADSMMTKSDLTRPFYLMLVSRMYMTAEAELAYKLFGKCYNALDARPGAVADFLYSDSKYVHDAFKEYWATSLAFYLRQEHGGDARDFLEQQQEKWLKACKTKSSKSHLQSLMELVSTRL